MAGSSVFPGSVDNKTEVQDGIDIIQADDVNDAYSMADAIETMIGTIGAGKTQSSSTDILDHLCNQPPMVTKASDSTLSVSAGTLAIKNAGQTNRMLRRNTGSTTVTAADIDTGSLVIGYYYLYAVADTAATTFTVKFSASATTPTGLTNYELIGWFYNQANGSLDISIPQVAAIKRAGRNSKNAIVITGATNDTLNDTNYGSDITEMVGHFYTSGGLTRIIASCGVEGCAADAILKFILDIDGSDISGSEKSFGSGGGTATPLGYGTVVVIWEDYLAAGTHTITLQGKIASSSATIDNKIMSIEER